MNKLEQNLTNLFEKYTEKQLIPGLSVHVHQRGKTLARVVTGLADLESGAVLKEDSLFRIYSMSKVITVIAAMQLYEKGLFTLNTPISDFIPSYGAMNIVTSYDGDKALLKPAKRPILMKHLFTMTSGIGYGFPPAIIPVDRFMQDHFKRSD